MPKETFFNLPADKQALICRVALDEFATYPFDQASVNRIVARSGIAKGSFYQYFENKQDLFLHLLQLVSEEKLGYLAPILRQAGSCDFFTLLRELYRAGIQFAIEHPQYVELGKKLLASKGSPVYEKAMDEGMPQAYRFFETLLADAIRQGQIRAGGDVKLLAYLIASLNTLVVEYYLEHVAAKCDERMMETIEQFLDLLRHGLEGNRAEGASS